jgi:hypothetical protein
MKSMTLKVEPESHANDGEQSDADFSCDEVDNDDAADSTVELSGTDTSCLSEEEQDAAEESGFKLTIEEAVTERDIEWVRATSNAIAWMLSRCR